MEATTIANGNGFDRLPRHVAIILDGNGRWAEKRGLPRIEGHRRGVNTARDATESFLNYGVKNLTLYAFSTENWRRPPVEVFGIFGIATEMLNRAIGFAREKGIRFRALGRTDGLPAQLQEAIQRAQDATRDLDAMTVSLCLNYGARDEILTAVQRMMARKTPIEAVTESLLGQFLYTAELPDPDLIIRTGGEQRLSNFLLWQAAYAELYFTDVLWPDFGDEEIRRALTDYGDRQRRFGAVPQSAI